MKPIETTRPQPHVDLAFQMRCGNVCTTYSLSNENCKIGVVLCQKVEQKDGKRTQRDHRSDSFSHGLGLKLKLQKVQKILSISTLAI
jgi:hypothetical protein